jgi:UDP-N-acetylmuramoyl-tripeptide--D-alanyl-D-alanine ligase
MSDAGYLWRADELETAMAGCGEGALPAGVTGASIDSRTIVPGDLFFAIRGQNSDGHDYVEAALKAGAALAVVSSQFAAGPRPLWRVADPLEALNGLARAARARTSGPVIAVTGSAGKTGTKEMLRLMLGASGPAHASEKSYNNLWGVPLSLARMPRESRFAVLEAGMNHAGEIIPLTQLIRPQIAIITTIAPVHMEFFASTADIAEAKAEIFQGLEPKGAAILPRDCEHFALLARRAQERGAEVCSFGEHPEAEARLSGASFEAARTLASADIFGERVEFELGAPGRHLALNAVAALAAVRLAGADLAAAARSLAGFAAPAGRGARRVFELPGGPLLVIDESYNANPASMRAALAVLGGTPRSRFRRRIAVLGDMLELGAGSRRLHEGLAPPIDEAGVDMVFACGPDMAALFETLPEFRRGFWAKKSVELVEPLLAVAGPGDAIMVKGSLGSRMGAVVEALNRAGEGKCIA